MSAADQDRHVSAERLQLAAQHDRWCAVEQASIDAAHRTTRPLERRRARGVACRIVRPDPSALACCRTASQLGTRPVSTPIACQEWAEALGDVLALEASRAVLAPDARRAVHMGGAILLVCGPLDANALVRRLDRLLGPGVHLGAVEEHGRRILELVISDEIANLELEIALQIYGERVDRLDERLHEFRQSQELQ